MNNFSEQRLRRRKSPHCGNRILTRRQSILNWRKNWTHSPIPDAIWYQSASIWSHPDQETPSSMYYSDTFFKTQIYSIIQYKISRGDLHIWKLLKKNLKKPKDATSNWQRNLSWVDMRHLHCRKTAATPTLLTRGNFKLSITTDCGLIMLNCFSIVLSCARVLELLQTGIIDKWDRSFHPMPRQCMANGINSGKKRQETKNLSISLKNLTGAFVVYFVGFSLSCLTFLFELIISTAQR